MNKVLAMLQVVDKERNLCCWILADFTSSFRVYTATLSKYLFGGQGLEQQWVLFYIFSSKQTHAQSQQQKP